LSKQFIFEKVSMVLSRWFFLALCCRNRSCLSRYLAGYDAVQFPLPGFERLLFFRVIAILCESAHNIDPGSACRLTHPSFEYQLVTSARWVKQYAEMGHISMPAHMFAEERRQEQLARAMDTVNDRFGDFKVTFGSMLDTEEKGSHVISPAWRPEGIRNVGLAASQSCTIRTPACCSRHETLWPESLHKPL
jgi:hypothetical protein